MKGARWLAWPMLLVFLMFGPAMGAEGQPPDEQSAGGEPPDDDAPMDSEALDALNRMAETLAQAQGFSVTIRASFDVVQDTGQKIAFGERRRVTLSRPDRLRVEVEESDGKRTLVIYDGKAITVFRQDAEISDPISQAALTPDGGCSSL
jgi:hypothetical protein